MGVYVEARCSASAAHETVEGALTADYKAGGVEFALR